MPSFVSLVSLGAVGILSLSACATSQETYLDPNPNRVDNGVYLGDGCFSNQPCAEETSSASAAPPSSDDEQTSETASATPEEEVDQLRRQVAALQDQYNRLEELLVMVAAARGVGGDTADLWNEIDRLQNCVDAIESIFWSAAWSGSMDDELAYFSSIRC